MKEKKFTAISRIQGDIQYKIKRLKRKRLLLTVKAVLFVILPVLIVLIGLEALKTYVNIKIRESCSNKKDIRETDIKERSKKDQAQSCIPLRAPR